VRRLGAVSRFASPMAGVGMLETGLRVRGMKEPLVLRCSACGQRNRVPVARAGAQGRCGKCKVALPGPAHPIEVEQAADLRAIIRGSKLPVVVDFWASWCGPCRMVAPEIAKVAQKQADNWLVVKANTEVDPALGAEHGIRSIPMMAVFHDGRELGRSAGARPAAAIETFVQQTLTDGRSR
jgi:thioredoxin 2